MVTNFDIFIYLVSTTVVLVRVFEQRYINKKPAAPHIRNGAIVSAFIPLFNTFLAIVSIHRWINPRK